MQIHTASIFRMSTLQRRWTPRPKGRDKKGESDVGHGKSGEEDCPYRGRGTLTFSSGDKRNNGKNIMK
jgi:hypothetical protein